MYDLNGLQLKEYPIYHQGRAAPYFEQNVCDNRFAILSEGETYYVMVDNYWPNPNLEDLVIHGILKKTIVIKNAS